MIPLCEGQPVVNSSKPFVRRVRVKYICAFLRLRFTHPCFYGIDTDNQSQLIAATKSIQAIAHQIGVDSLAYLSWEGMLTATGEIQRVSAQPALLVITLFLSPISSKALN